MVIDVNELFSEDSLLVTRYNLTDEQVHEIRLFYECFHNYKKVGKDLEVIIPCVLLVLNLNKFKIDLKSEVRYLVSVLFDESEIEMNRRQSKIYVNFMKFADDYQECGWYYNWKQHNNN
ncbi:hypothetical protein [Methanosarcina mazei]|uniref:Uncharacterized protein n=1 Tax=Methanosarcina mazei TaxID=2209 RepID=A0A0F8KH41_METMZ|nr:hypothetical protein [Methanosarcina mazei]KKG52359.1 hypothetical protein DU33_18820 [Methanosarcina mazei]KKG61347.1 hypothetical protein DU45_05985 [Methanosarcina mazei]KKG63284.1 hypothetical protein DU64_09420 [Methanosarcina mazei]KKG95233.1 hypothetical protein DU66_16160 [Methanosarcina mazei]KKG97345.1 hypothetical protein DU68_17495 [Methanosarcina mazei]